MGVSVFQHSAFVWVCVTLAGGSLVAAVAVWARTFWSELAARFLRLPAAGKAAFVAFVAVATAVAQKPGREIIELSNNRIIESADVSNLVNPVNPVEENLRASVSPCEESVTDDDIARGYRLAEVRTNETVSYELPMNGAVVGTWHMTDAYEAVVRVWLEEGRRKKEEGRSAELSSSFLPAQPDKDASATALLPSSFFLLPSQQTASATTLLPSSLFLFPLGQHVVTSLWAHVWGKARPQLRNASNELVAVGAPMFARHGVSRLWTAATTNGTVLLTWESFFIGNNRIIEYLNNRMADSSSTNSTDSANSINSTNSTNSTIRLFDYSIIAPIISAQLELFPSGDFIARSNEVARVYRRVNPDDWDDDGIPNGEDDDPRIAADETQFGSHQTLPEDANANAYCWVDLVVPQANALVTFIGDGASNLADPSFIAKAGEVNRVTLLIGKTYRVTCPLPFRIAAKSSDEIEESWQSDGSLLLHWPVSVSSSVTDEDDSSDAQRAAIRQASSVGVGCLAVSPLSSLLAATTTGTLPVTRSHTFVMSVVPSGLGGLFDWTTHCCSISGMAYSFEQTCRDACACSGCSTEGFFEYEGYRLCVYGPVCPCSGAPVDIHGDDEDDEQPSRGVSAYFTKFVIFLEDEYENAPGEIVPWQSTETKLVCSAAGGPFGGRVKIEIEGADNLIQYTGPTLPFEQALAAGEDLSFKIRYRAVKESGAANDIKVTATFVENETEWEQESLETATAVRVVVQPKVPAPENESFGRHKYGVREEVSYRYFPSVAPVTWRTTSGELQDGGTFVCPLSSAENPLTISGGNASYSPLVSVVEPTGIECRDVKAERYGVPVNHAGGIGMVMDLYVLPLDVSFTGIAVEEVPCLEGTHTGYFAHSQFSGVWSHTVENGAGNWVDVQEGNLFGEDRPAITGELPRITADGNFVSDVPWEWQDGELIWPIPYGWNEKGTQQGVSEHKRFGTDTQHWTIIFRNGRSGVRKLQNQVYRDIDGTVNLNGRIIDESE